MLCYSDKTDSVSFILGKTEVSFRKKKHTHTKKKTSYPLSHAFVEDIIRLNVAQQVDDINK